MAKKENKNDVAAAKGGPAQPIINKAMDLLTSSVNKLQNDIFNHLKQADVIQQTLELSFLVHKPSIGIITVSYMDPETKTQKSAQVFELYRSSVFAKGAKIGFMRITQETNSATLRGEFIASDEFKTLVEDGK